MTFFGFGLPKHRLTSNYLMKTMLSLLVHWSEIGPLMSAYPSSALTLSLIKDFIGRHISAGESNWIRISMIYVNKTEVGINKRERGGHGYAIYAML